MLRLRYLQNLVLHLQGVHPADGVLLWEQKQTVVRNAAGLARLAEGGQLPSPC